MPHPDSKSDPKPKDATKPEADAQRVRDKSQHAAKCNENHRLEEGLEETFPASDPVSASHIT